jgi:hypothetical protein
VGVDVAVLVRVVVVVGVVLVSGSVDATVTSSTLTSAEPV